MPEFSARFLLSNNFPGSGTRLTSDFANAFVRRGIPTEILYPSVDWWDYKCFTLPGVSRGKRWKWRLQMAGEAVRGAGLPPAWCGFRHHSIDSRVRVRRYGRIPSAAGWTPEAVTVVHCPYQIPHLLKTLPSARTKLVSVIHINLEEAMASETPEVAAWYRHCAALDRLLRVPRYAVSEVAKRSAERLGIPVQKVIHNGVDLKLFRPMGAAGPRPDPSWVVTLYCDLKTQKGQIYGLRALQAVREAAGDRNLQFRSIGAVIPGYAGLFDRHYGYLHGEAYAKALRESDVLVYPSLYDGFPAPPLEALASGCALVTTSVEGVTEYAVDGENCLLSEPANVGMLKDQILRALDQQELRRRIQNNGPKTAERFSIDHCAGELLGFLEQVHEETSEETPHPWVAVR